MKVVAKSIDMVAWFTKDGMPHPVRFRIQNDDESYEVIKINRIVCVEREKLAGNPMIIFTCRSIIHGVEKIYVIKYEINTCKWILFKI